MTTHTGNAGLHKKLNSWKSEKADSCQLSPHQPHQPSREKNSAHEHEEALDAVTNLFLDCIPLRNAEHNRSEECEYDRSAEM
jgi:hypothetical protein